MRNEIAIHPWGARVYLDEARTQELLTVLDNGSSAGALLTAVDPEMRSKVILSLALAIAKIEATLIRQVDQRGGSNGVVISALWTGTPVWVVAQ